MTMVFNDGNDGNVAQFLRIFVPLSIRGALTQGLRSYSLNLIRVMPAEGDRFKNHLTPQLIDLSFIYLFIKLNQ